jgi:hypothetical protein
MILAAFQVIPCLVRYALLTPAEPIGMADPLGAKGSVAGWRPNTPIKHVSKESIDDGNFQ